MRLLDRYLLRELLIPLVYCLCGFLIFWISFDLFSELDDFQRYKLHALDVTQYYLVRVPKLLVDIVAPITLLLALLYALTNHARHHELTAMRAAGVSLWRLCLPYLAVGFIFSVSLFAVNEWWVPSSAERADQILNRYAASQPGSTEREWHYNLNFKNARDHRLWNIGAYNVKTFEMKNTQDRKSVV